MLDFIGSCRLLELCCSEEHGVCVEPSCQPVAGTQLLPVAVVSTMLPQELGSSIPPTPETPSPCRRRLSSSRPPRLRWSPPWAPARLTPCSRSPSSWSTWATTTSTSSRRRSGSGIGQAKTSGGTPPRSTRQPRLQQLRHHHGAVLDGRQEVRHHQRVAAGVRAGGAGAEPGRWASARASSTSLPPASTAP
uniref:Uncharacterized protein n=1 Tax=Setaria viridis TaxID=4556 RepID=A0A4U6VDE5_SETVI|nr:hypothetical protein SEVIR_4G204001v2 [Setaria viridis]